MKGFNKGVVRGKIIVLEEKSSKKKTPYLDLRIACPNGELGDVTAFGRLWGANQIQALKKAHKDDPGAVWKFVGRFSQLRDRQRTLYGFNFYRFEPNDKPEMRTSFILRGELMSKDYPEDRPEHTVVRIKVTQEEEALFELYAPWGLAEQMHIGNVYQVNGRIVDEDAAFESSGDTMPLVMEVKTPRKTTGGTDEA